MNAAITDHETGDYITQGLQGSDVSDQAWRCAVEIAAERSEPVVLHDDDGDWLVHPDGTREVARG